MNPSSWFGGGGHSSVEVLWEDSDRVFCKRRHYNVDADQLPVLVVLHRERTPRRDVSIYAACAVRDIVQEN
jgi:hypothetical protein